MPGRIPAKLYVWKKDGKIFSADCSVCKETI